MTHSELFASQVQWTGQSRFMGNITVSWMGQGSYAAVIEGDERTYYPVENGTNFGVGPTVRFESPLDIFKKWNQFPVTVWLMDDGTGKGFQNWNLEELTQ